MGRILVGLRTHMVHLSPHTHPPSSAISQDNRHFAELTDTCLRP